MRRRADDSWSNPKVLAIFAVLFLCGIACGSALTTGVFHWRLHNTSAGLGLSQLKEKLDLTPEQERIVTKQLDDYAKYYENIEEQREDVAEVGKQKIMAVLTPEQQRLFLKMFKTGSLPTRPLQ